MLICSSLVLRIVANIFYQILGYFYKRGHPNPFYSDNKPKMNCPKTPMAEPESSCPTDPNDQPSWAYYNELQCCHVKWIFYNMQYIMCIIVSSFSRLAIELPGFPFYSSRTLVVGVTRTLHLCIASVIVVFW